MLPVKPWYESALRRRIGLPKHCTANDDALVLLRLAMLSIATCVIVAVSTHWIFAWWMAFTTSAFLGLSVQQYVWYTGRIFNECWSQEGVAVAAVVSLSAAALGFMTLLFSLLMPSLLRMLVCGGLHAALLTSYRWAFWGSLFDGTEKANKKRDLGR